MKAYSVTPFVYSKHSFIILILICLNLCLVQTLIWPFASDFKRPLRFFTLDRPKSHVDPQKSHVDPQKSHVDPQKSLSINHDKNLENLNNPETSDSLEVKNSDDDIRWETFNGEDYIEYQKYEVYKSSINVVTPEKFQEESTGFLQEYTNLPDLDSKLELIHKQMKFNLENLAFRNYESNLNWLKSYAAICQTSKNLIDQIKIDTVINLGLRDFMNKYAALIKSSKKFSKTQAQYKKNYYATFQLKKYRESFHQEKYFDLDPKPLRSELRKADWSQEVLYPSFGLGNSGNLDKFKTMLQESPEVLDFFKDIAKPTKKLSYVKLKFWKSKTKKPMDENKFITNSIDENNFINKLAQTIVSKDGTETSSKTRTASIILLWHIMKKPNDELNDLLYDGFKLSEEAPKLADTQFKSISRSLSIDSKKKITSLTGNDLILFHTLEKESQFQL